MAHITKEQRYTIAAMKEQGLKQEEMAQRIGKDKSVVSRELKRNRDRRSGHYHADPAQRKYDRRQKDKPKHIRFTPQVQTHVEQLLREDLSPEQIAGVSKEQGIDCVSLERIYQHIWADKKAKGELHTHLRRRGRRNRKRVNMKDHRASNDQ